MIALSKDDRFYVHLFPWGEVHHGGEVFQIDRGFYRLMKQAYDFLVRGDDRPPQYPPIKRQHGDDGFVYGLIVDLFSTDEKPLPEGFSVEGIYIEVAPGKALKEWREDGLIGDWSPGFSDVWRDPHTDEEFQYVLRECSFVSDGHLKATEKQHTAYALSASGFAVITNVEEGMEEKKMQDEMINREEIDEMKSAIESLAGQVGRIAAMLEEQGMAEESEVEEGEEMASCGDEEMEAEEKTDMASLQRKIATMEKRLEREVSLRLKTQAENAIAKSGVELAAEERAAMLKLAAKDPESFNSSLKILQAKEARLRELSAKDAPVNPFAFSEVGSMGAPATKAADLEKVREYCMGAKQSGVTRFQAFAELSKRGLVNPADGRSVERAKSVLGEIFG